MYRKLLLLLLLFVSATTFAQVPSISSFNPASGAVGTAVTITGSNFGATAAKNVVVIGGVKATVLSASSTSLTVTVPLGATYGAISVATNGFTASSLNSFVVTYPNGGSMFETYGGLAPKTDLVVGNSSTLAVGLVSADFDGDGKPDIATLLSGLGLYIYKNLGDHTMPFGSIPSLKLNQPGVGFFEGASFIGVGDFNGDGKPDIITTHYTTGGNIVVFKNTSTPGNLSFAAPQSFTIEGYANAVAIGDFNGDGKLDIATSNNGTSPVFSVLLNNGSNGNISFAAKQDFPVGGDPTSIAVGDFDGDGKLDVVTANHGDYTISVLRNTTANGVLSFAPKIDYPVGTSLSPITVLTADLDGDGKTDIITTNHLDFGEAKTGSIFRNISTTGNIAFSAKTDYYTGVFSQAATIADMDGDGKPDLILVDKTSNTCQIFNNKSVPGTIDMEGGGGIQNLNYPNGVVAGDFTGDGKPDVVVMSQGTSNSFISTAVNTVNPANPVINSVSSMKAAEGDNVTITGTHFTGATAVKFGGYAATSFTVVSSTTIKAVVGKSASGAVEVITPVNQADFSGFVFINKPAVSSMTVALDGTSYFVVINGLYLSNASTVSFDGAPATSFTVVSDNQIKAFTNNNTFNAVNITTPGGSGVYYYGQLPRITALSTLTATEGSSITITGVNFTNVTAVTLGDGAPAASFQVLSPTSIKAVYGKGNTGNVSVTTLYGKANSMGVAPSGFVNFTGPPIISSLSQTSATQGTRIGILGMNFPVSSTVTFGGVPASSVNVGDWSGLTATVGNGASGDVVVTTPQGSATYPGFTFLLPTAIKSFSGNTTTGSAVTITGTQLDKVTGITFGGVPAQSFTINSPTSITAIVGLGSSGSIVATYGLSSSTLGGFVYTPSAPVITSFSPTSTGPQQIVNIKGTDFNGATAVTFGGVPAASFVVNSITSITAMVGAGASGNVTVTTPKGTATLGGFGVTGGPVINSFAPNTAQQGTSVTITGTNFTNAKTVSFGNVAASSFTVNSATSITAVVGAGKTGNIKVVTPKGTATLPGFTFAAAPVISSLSPATGSTGMVVTITGTNFEGATAVTFGGVPAQLFTIHSATSISAKIGAGASGNVVVTTPFGNGTRAGFTYNAAPVITSFTPVETTANKVVTITGSNFTGATAVSFGGNPALSFTVHSANSISAKVGTGQSGVVRVTTPSGSGSLAGFIYDTPPIISSVSPLTGTVGSIITIRGTNLNGTTAVSFGGVPAETFTVHSATYISAKVGTGNSGVIKITTAAGTGTASGFIYNAAPTITSFTPAEAKTGVVISIRGTNLGNTTAVSFGGVAAQAFTIHSATYISAKVGAGASGSIQITSPSGSGTLAGFTYDAAPALASLMPGDDKSAMADSSNLSMFYTLSNDKKILNLSLSGSRVYHIQLNGILYTTTDSNTTLPLVYGKNELTVTTDKLYQGAIKKIIMATDNIVPYPNPFEGILYLNIGSRKVARASVVVYSNMGVILYQHQFSNPLNTIRLDLPAVKTKGIYTLRLTLDGTPSVYKVIRK